MMKWVVPLLVLCLVAAARAAPPISGTWSGDLFGHETVFELRERDGGGITGFLPADPNARIVDGLVAGKNVSLHIAISDPGLSATGTITGTITGNKLNGTFDLGGVPTPVSFKRGNKRYTIEYWLMGEDDIQSRARRVLDRKGGFVSGGYTGIDTCDFLSCAGDFPLWDVSLGAHSLAAQAGGGCFLDASLAGMWNDADKFLVGTYDGADCNGVLSGDFIGGKAGVADLRGLRRVLVLLAGFADRVQAESISALDLIADDYLNDGKTKLHWQSDLVEIYNDYDNLSVRIARIDEVVTENDADVNPMVLLPPRVQWRMVVTGEPGGGPAETALDTVFALEGNQQLYWIGKEKKRYVFTGNGYSEPFAIELPIDGPGDSANAAYGLWPFGVHGGGHPEGHAGWDVEYAAGSRVHAAADGIVTQIVPNDDFPLQFNITIEHRPGFSTRYDHVTNPLPAIVVDAPVAVGDILGDPGDFGSFFAVHFALRSYTESVCPTEVLSPSAASLFDEIWSDAAYDEELVEPFPCQALAAGFPLTRIWQRTAGPLSPSIEFTRTSPASTVYGYTLRDAAESVIETGTASIDTSTMPAAIDLVPDGAGATHLGVYRIVSGEMLIDWDDVARPVNLAGASTYQTE